MADFELSPKVVPNEEIALDRAYFPAGHRGVLDTKRQLVVGNRGVGKSFWTHALVNDDLRMRLAEAYGLPALARTDVVIGFNGSEKLLNAAPTIEELGSIKRSGVAPDTIWRAVLLRAALSRRGEKTTFQEMVRSVLSNPRLFAERLSEEDDKLVAEGRSLIVVFDALDRLAPDWDSIRSLTKELLVRALGLQSFRAIRLKIFMRVDQFSDAELFRFPDSSKIRNDYVNMTWRPHELYGLLFFELSRAAPAVRASVEAIASRSRSQPLLSDRAGLSSSDEFAPLVTAIAGEFMGGHKKRGRVITWVPLHLSDAANDCSPRTFLTAWKTAAEHFPPPVDKVVDHLGLIDGVRSASSARLTELREDYPWIDRALAPLRREFVPILREDLFNLWDEANVIETILTDAARDRWLAPISLMNEKSPSSLLQTLARIGVMEERANQKINVPDIFRVEAEILRKGGVAVPKRGQ
jgi:hypothetical protein